MLYLAEVQKKGSFMGARTELRLLARQQSEQSWVAITGEEWLSSEEASAFNSGALVLVDIAGNRQVQRVQEASRQLVSILQNFSRLQEKFRTQEEEIEQWKQSLTYQSQELNRREMEMEARREQLQQLEEDFEQLEAQRLEVESSRTEINQLREEMERNRAELEGAWAHLRGEQRRFAERQESVQTTALDTEQAHYLQSLIDQIGAALINSQPIRSSIDDTFGLLEQRQAELTQHWQELEHLRVNAEQQQGEVDRGGQDLHQRWQQWHEAQASLEKAQAELKVQQHSLNLKEEQARMLTLQIQNYEELYQQTYQLAESTDGAKVSQSIDSQALEKLSIEELQTLVNDLERDFRKLSHFVNDQEEELKLQQEAIDELLQQLENHEGFERIELESNMDFEQQRYQMLEETLVGQRRSLREREELLTQHQNILARRQGKISGESQKPQIDLSPVLTQLEGQKQQQAQALEKLEGQLEQLRSTIGQMQGTLSQQATDQEHRRNELKELENQHRNQMRSVAELWGKVNTYQELLRPLQDGVDALRSQLQTTAETLLHLDQASQNQQQALGNLRQTVESLLASPELAAS
ncbi:pilus motility taxis protein HmpF [Leptolyngbya sp. FACHB-261]|uniref:pilus motility taxis protein HmpF n=1 Tax=Leptolyngbya sp. FACHB-261 TaxID=2692806 RepID=UPI001681E454|nr:pilus motility taxis protein HmpF [Leptolyngbya sp. FACHB-261]MBD2105267.1 hypothetical protein [Leptolyngbya sp. FACHB-261]